MSMFVWSLVKHTYKLLLSHWILLTFERTNQSDFEANGLWSQACRPRQLWMTRSSFAQSEKILLNSPTTIQNAVFCVARCSA